MIPSEPINILTIQFANTISHHEIPLFRGAVIHSLENKLLLFHNHDSENYRYAYPLIQYKRIKGKAAIVCIGKGKDAISEFFSSNQLSYEIGKKNTEMRIESIHADLATINLIDTQHYYQLHNWLPLNSKNYQLFQETDNLVEKLMILERVLTGNILSFLKGIDIHLEDKLEVHITQITNQRITFYKKIKFMAFDIEFKANISLPPYIGIGKNASIGYGMLTKNTH